MKKIKVGTVLVGTMLATGCSAVGGEALFVGEDVGRFVLSADRAGLEAFGDALNGVIVNTKAPPEIESPHWQLRKKQTEVKVFKVQAMKGAK